MSNPFGIIPEPVSTVIYTDKPGFRLERNQPIPIVFSQLIQNPLRVTLIQLLSPWVTASDLVAIPPSPYIQLTLNTLPAQSSGESGAEAYTLSITTHTIHIDAHHPSGLLYAVQTLCQILDSSFEKTVHLSCADIKDYPRFGWRGCLLDCSRHFMDIEFVKHFVKVLAYHKMNRLHWHLVDDQGWRIEIDRYPLLTKVSSKRTNADGTEYGGYYTKQEIRSVVELASSLGIIVVPEIELPGHCVATLAAYPELGCTRGPYQVPCEWGIFEDVYCAGRESTFEFLQNVLQEVLELFPSPWIHVGGDEVPKSRWEACRDCQGRMQQLQLKDYEQLQSYFVKDEILEGGLAQGAIVQSWRGTAGGIQAAKMGHHAIMSPTTHCYFDYPLSKIDLEKVYTFEPIPSELQQHEKAFIIGGECCMWSERAPQETVFGKVYPRLLALVTKLWCEADIQNKTSFAEFKKSMLDIHFKRLAHLGVVGVQDGMLL